MISVYVWMHVYPVIALAACGVLDAQDLVVQKRKHGCCPHGAYGPGEVSASLRNRSSIIVGAGTEEEKDPVRPNLT